MNQKGSPRFAPASTKVAGEAGFSSILVIIGVVLIVGVGFTIFKLTSKNQEIPQFVTEQSGTRKVESPKNTQDSNPDEPPLKLKSIGVNFEDFKFTKEKLQFNRIFMGFGFVIPGNETSSGQDKSNPQPTYILPLGTPVRSLVDGIVANIPTVWSGDYSIQITKSGKLERWVYEVEHVLNPKVKVGDQVKAGQIIAEVSDFDKGAPQGYGAVEIGILRGGQTPEHICPFAYLDDSIKEETFTNLRNLFKDWEEYVGDSTLYDESLSIPGCLTLDPIPG